MPATPEVRDLTRAERVARLQYAIENWLVLRERWYLDCVVDGQPPYRRMCLVGWLAPEAAKDGDAAKCPREVMPAWLAHWSTVLNDRTTSEKWRPLLVRYAGLLARWWVLGIAAWRRLDWTARRIALRCLGDAERPAIALLDRAIGGEVTEQGPWAAERDALYERSWVGSRTRWALASDSNPRAATELLIAAHPLFTSGQVTGPHAHYDSACSALLDAIEIEVVAAEAKNA